MTKYEQWLEEAVEWLINEWKAEKSVKTAPL